MSDFRHQQIPLDRISLHVVEAGDPAARPVVFLHGWPQSWAEWQQLMTIAAGEFHAIAIDLPGVGESTPGAVDGSKRTLAAVVHALIERLDLKDATLVGHDIGGMVAYAYLMEFFTIWYLCLPAPLPRPRRRRDRRRGHPRPGSVG